MNIALVTGSAGLIGSESVAFFAEKFDLVIGIDNNLRSYFFGAEASTDWNRKGLEEKYSNYFYSICSNYYCLPERQRHCCPWSNIGE